MENKNKLTVCIAPEAGYALSDLSAWYLVATGYDTGLGNTQIPIEPEEHTTISIDGHTWQAAVYNLPDKAFWVEIVATFADENEVPKADAGSALPDASADYKKGTQTSVILPEDGEESTEKRIASFVYSPKEVDKAASGGYIWFNNAQLLNTNGQTELVMKSTQNLKVCVCPNDGYVLSEITVTYMTESEFAKAKVAAANDINSLYVMGLSSVYNRTVTAADGTEQQVILYNIPEDAYHVEVSAKFVPVNTAAALGDTAKRTIDKIQLIYSPMADESAQNGGYIWLYDAVYDNENQILYMRHENKLTVGIAPEEGYTLSTIIAHYVGKSQVESGYHLLDPVEFTTITVNGKTLQAAVFALPEYTQSLRVIATFRNASALTPAAECGVSGHFEGDGKTHTDEIINEYCNATPKHVKCQTGLESMHFCDPEDGGCGLSYPCTASNSHAICKMCGKHWCDKSTGDHRAPCGIDAHRPCLFGDEYKAEEHERCELCGEFLCNNENHGKGECVPDDIICPMCEEVVDTEDAHEMPCGHYSCVVDDMSEHEICGLCGDFLCWSEHGKGKCVPADILCPECKQVVDTEDAHKMPCGHYSCQIAAGSDHTRKECGHYACDGRNHNVCTACGGRYCSVGEHEMLECGNCCERHKKETHEFCGGMIGCGGWKCDGKDHSSLPCDHCAQAPGNHTLCNICGSFLCWGEHGRGICDQ